MSTLKARPTVYNGIQMRSRLEARWAAVLDRDWGRWAYEPRAYATQGGQYLPDFEILDAGLPVFMEVRPTIDRGWSATLQMEIIWASLPDAMLYVIVPDSDTMIVGERPGRPWVEMPLDVLRG